MKIHQIIINMQYAVYEKNPEHTGSPNSIILSAYKTKEEAQSAREKYGYNTDNYYVDVCNTEFPGLTRKINMNDVSHDYICHSGGCPGADMGWETEGNKYQIHTISYSFHNHKQEGKNPKILSHIELQEGYEAAKIADITLRRNFDNIVYPYVKNLLARNWFQVKNSESVYAISKKFLSDGIVDGGTGWAVQMAIDNNKPVYVFDQPSKKWYKYSTTKNIFESITSAAPKLTRNFAGIGTRDLTDEGLKAIVDTYVSTIDYAFVDAKE